MRVGISATYASSQASFRNAGISRYIQRIVEGLAAFDDSLDVYTSREFEPPAEWDSPKIRVHRDSPSDRVKRTLWDLRAGGVAAREGYDVWFSTGNVAPTSGRVPRLAMIHDLIPLRHPEYFSTANALFLNFQFRRTCRMAERLVTNSETTKRDIVELIGVPAERIDVAPLGVGNDVAPVDPSSVDLEALRALGVPEEPFLFSLCTLEPRKNLDRLIQAIAIVRRSYPELKLVVGGARGWKESRVFDRLQREGLEDAVTFLGYVPDEALAGIFARCEAFVYPSLYEGFGMPILEAMRTGAPALTSAGGAMEEVAAEAAAGYFDPRSVESIAGAIEAFLRSGVDRRDVAQRSILRGSEFTWERTARITREAMLRVVN